MTLGTLIEISPLIVLLFISAIGSFSKAWGRLCFSIFVVSVVQAIVVSLVLFGWSFGSFLGYFGGLISIVSGIFIYHYNLGVYALPNNIRKVHEATMSFLSLVMLEVILTLANQAIFNHPPSINEPIYKLIYEIRGLVFIPSIFIITTLQIILLLKGFTDGIRILADDQSSHRVPVLSSIQSTKVLARHAKNDPKY